MFYYLLANLLPSCCAGLNFLNCGVIDIMILLIRAIKSNSFWILSAEENFVIKEESVSQLANGIWEIHAGCPSFLRVSYVAKIGYIPQFKASNARDQDEVSSDLARMPGHMTKMAAMPIYGKIL